MSIRQVRAPEVAERLARGDALVLLDVRRHDEVVSASLDGSIHIPLDELADSLDELDPDREYVIYCHHGVRSISAAAMLQCAGIERVASMAGGIDAWSRLVDPRVPRY